MTQLVTPVQLASPSRRYVRPVREVALAFAVFLAWQVVVFSTQGAGPAAVERGSWLWHAEEVIGVRAEPVVQSAVSTVPAVLGALDSFYLVGHWLVTLAGLWLLLLVRPDVYRWVRFRFAAATVVCTLVQVVAVAPPWMVSHGAVVDTLATAVPDYAGAAPVAGLYSSMPSLHVVWCLFVALASWRLGGAWRPLGIGYAALMVVTVVATGNHTLLDCAAAGVLVALVVVVADRIGSARRSWS